MPPPPFSLPRLLYLLPRISTSLSTANQFIKAEK
jgi:hypothetical protein